MAYTKGLKQVTLGELIDALKRREPDQKVRFDFGNFVPEGVDSYRGYYEDLAVRFTDTNYDNWPTVESFVAMLEGAVGKAYHGWKGGEYVMTRDTPLWVGNSGESYGTAITGIHPDCSYSVILTTEYVD